MRGRTPCMAIGSGCTVHRWIEDDGRRAASGFKGEADDCVARAIAIASGRRLPARCVPVAIASSR